MEVRTGAKSSNEINNPLPETVQDSLTPLLEENTPEFLWIADKPINLGGALQKISTTKEAKEKFNFNYCENIVISNELATNFTFVHPSENKVIWNKINQRLQNPLNDKLVICFIDEQVGYGVFAKEFIEAGTIIGIYAGEIEKKTERNDYGMSIGDTPFRINAQKHGGITRFIQHMPFSFESIAEAIRTSDKTKFLKILDGNGYYFNNTQKKLLNTETLAPTKEEYIAKLDKVNKEVQQEMFENERLKSIKKLATANIIPLILNYQNQPILYFRTVLDIQKGEQLGVSYGLEYWIKKGIIPQYFDKDGNLILRSLYVPTLNELLAKYIPSEAESAISKNYALHQAAFEGDIYDVKVLLFEYGAEIDNQVDNLHQRTPLHVAIIGCAHAIVEKRNDIQERKAVIKLLIDRNADRDKKDKCNSTALHYAVKNKLEDIAVMLLSYGAVVKEKGVDGKKPFDYDPQMAHKIFSDKFKEHRSDLLSGYAFNAVLEGKTNHWAEGELVAGLYVDKITNNNIFISFGKKNNKRAISIINYKDHGNISVEAIRNECGLFDEIDASYIICQRPQLVQKDSFNNLCEELKKFNITYKVKSIDEGCDILIAHYIFHEGNIHFPRIGYLNDIDLEYFYGELIEHSVPIQPEKIDKKSIKNQSTQAVTRKLSIGTVGTQNQKDSVLSELSRITGNSWLSNTDGTKFWMKAEKKLVDQIMKHISSKDVGEIKKINHGATILIENAKLPSLEKVAALKGKEEEIIALKA